MTFLKLSRERLTVGIVVVVVLIVVGGLAWGFGQQIALSWRLRAEERRLEQAVATEQARHDELVDRLEYVKSDEYVECWAREEAKLAKPGEVVVIPVVAKESEQPASEAQAEEPAASESPPFWVTWWEKLFGPGDAERP